MILAAGLGTRLHPITQTIPKPLVPVLNVPNVLHSLALMKRAGAEDVILNLHHLPAELEKFLGDGSKWKMQIAYTHESQLLGTGGGLKKAEWFLGKEPFILANCDFVCDFDLRNSIERHFRHKALGTLVLLDDPKRQHLYSKVGVTPTGHLCQVPKKKTETPSRTGIFTGIHFLDPQAFHHLDEKPCGINDVLYPQWMEKDPSRVFGDFAQGSWYDTGDFPAFFQSSMSLLGELATSPTLRNVLQEYAGYEEKTPGIWAPEEISLPKGVHFVGPVVLGRNCHFDGDATIGPYCVLGDGSEVGRGVRLSRCVGIENPQLLKTAEGFLQFKNSILFNE